MTKNGEWFTVIPVPEGVIAVNDEAGLKEALSQVTDGGTIMLAGDITLTSPLTINQNVTLMGYGNQIVAGGFEGYYVSIGSSVTNVTIQKRTRRIRITMRPAFMRADLAERCV